MAERENRISISAKHLILFSSPFSTFAQGARSSKLKNQNAKILWSLV